MKIFIAIPFLFASFLLQAQTVARKTYREEFSAITENDSYLLQRNDKYYTNGLFFILRTAAEKGKSKIIHQYELGQMIYTPRLLTAQADDKFDRPFCGYLFAKYTHTGFTEKNQALQWYISAGTIGRTSMADNFQNSLHHLLGLYSVSGWGRQVHEDIAINWGITYIPSFTKGHSSSSIKLVPVMQANMGNVFVNAKAGGYLCIGAFEDNSNSVLLNAGIDAHQPGTKRNYELFFYFYPQVIIQGYNATVQGSFLGDNTNSFTSVPTTIMYQQTWGLAYAKNRWVSKVEVVYQTKECTTQLLDQRYASLQLSYRFN